jgi:CheY-like chemotaxis protein/two-component sensor histidine kinase
MVINSEEFSFSRMMDQVTAIIGGQCHNKGLNFDYEQGAGLLDYYIGDNMKLKQVLINILGNSVKFTPAGGRVILRVEKQAEYDGNSTLKFTVSDTGIGMSKEYLPRLFEAFTQEDSSSTSRYGSTGLGMPITKNLVELMNGTIEVESEKGVGTTFTVTIPLKDSDRKDSDTSSLDISPHEMSVLVIDDDPVACEHARLVLGQVGIGCDTALSGSGGIEMVKLRHARREPYNLILVDWKMPEMDGIETTRQIRQIVGAESAIIFLTSFNWDDVADEAKKAGIDSFVAKPLLASSVLDEFKTAFKNKNHSEEDKEISLAGRRVLLAEDVAINAEIMIMVLSMREIAVDHAENGKLAVEMFENHEPGYYDAILMDMRMPEMDGLEATKVIRSMNREDSERIPIIALTANAFDEDVQRSLQAGLNAHLSKPVEPDALYETLTNLIN